MSGVKPFFTRRSDAIDTSEPASIKGILVKLALSTVATVLALTFLALAGTARAQSQTEQASRPAPGEQTILVAGATGRTGRLVIALLKEEGYRVRAMTRDPLRAQEEIGADYQWVKADARDPASLTRVMQDIDKVICVIGASRGDPTNTPEAVDYGGVRNLTDAARAAGVEHFVLVSSAGVTHKDHILNKIADNLLIWKLKGENHLRASGMAYTIVRPTGLRDWAGGEYGIFMDQGDAIGDGLIARADVAAVLVAALSDPAALNKTFEIFNYKALDPASWRGGFRWLKPDPATAPQDTARPEE